MSARTETQEADDLEDRVTQLEETVSRVTQSFTALDRSVRELLRRYESPPA